MKLYIDPGTGSMLFTVLIGLLGALFYALRNVILKTRFWVSGGKQGKEQDTWPYVILRTASGTGMYLDRSVRRWRNAGSGCCT